MREIIFRGKDKETNEWVYGDLIQGEFTYISTPKDFYNACVSVSGHLSTFVNIVNPETVGRYIGLHYKNGKGVYEDDIILETITRRYGVIQFSHGMFGINWDYAKNNDPDWKKGTMYGSWGTLTNLRRIDDGFLNDDDIIYAGNIHDNPELLIDKESERCVIL